MTVMSDKDDPSAFPLSLCFTWSSTGSFSPSLRKDALHSQEVTATFSGR